MANNNEDISTQTCDTQASTRNNGNYYKNPASKRWRRKGPPRRSIPQNDGPKMRQLILEHLSCYKSQLSIQEMDALAAIIGPQLERLCVNRALNADGFWGLHGWGKYVSAEDLDTLDAQLAAIFTRLDAMLDAGNRDVITDHCCVKLMRYDLAEERDWRRADPDRLPLAAIDALHANTAHDAGRWV